MTTVESTTEVRRCRTCGETKPLEAFRAREPERRLRMHQCRPCELAVRREQKRSWSEAHRAEVRARRRQGYAANAEAERERCRRWRLLNPTKHMECVQNAIQQHPERERARQMLRSAIRRGLVARPSVCSGCGNEQARIEAHHADYGRPFEVEWLCRLCHGKRHRKDDRSPPPAGAGRGTEGT
jgi:hypothetical protein